MEITVNITIKGHRHELNLSEVKELHRELSSIFPPPKEMDLGRMLDLQKRPAGGAFQKLSEPGVFGFQL